MSETDADEPVSRRGFLRTAAGTAAIAGASGTAAAQEGTSSGGSGSGGGSGTKTVAVGPGGNVFDPETLTIAPGTAVEFAWKSSGHNVVPEEGDWGHEPLEDQGFSYTTPPFEQTGSNEYWCAPHKGAGMVGTIEVQEGGASSGGSSEPVVPGSAKTLGVAAMSFMLSTLGLAYVFMKYGGDYRSTSEE